MSAIPKIIIFVLITLLSFSVQAQTLDKADVGASYAKKKFLLQLPNKVVYQMNNKKFKNEEIGYWLQFAIDSVHYDSVFKGIPSNKNLYQLSVIQDIVYITPVKNKDWNIFIINQQNIHGLKVFDFEGKERITSKITCNKSTINYDTKLGMYVLKKVKNNAAITIEDGEHLAFYTLNYYKPRPLSKIYTYFTYTLFNRTTKKDFNGFIAFSQPKYRPGDTMHIKAYVVDKKGRPINKALTLKISTYHYNNGYGTTLIPIELLTTPNAPGNFEWQIPVTDTFIIDKSYTVALFDGNFINGIEESIFIEDYELDKTSYTLKSSNPNNVFSYGDKIAFIANALDFNGNPVMDGELILKVSASINKLYVRSLFVPDTLWYHQQPLDVKGTTTVVFPDSLIPNGQGNLYVQAFFKNSNNELHESALNLTFDQNPDKWLVTQSDSIYIAFLKNNKVEKGDLLLSYYDKNQNLIEQKKIANPSTVPFNPLAKQYVLNNSNSSSSHTFYPTTFASVSLVARRNLDTVSIEVLNPKKLDVVLSIYQEDKLLTSLQLNDAVFYKNISNSYGKNFYAKLSYLWNGEEMYAYSEMLYKKNELTVSFEHQNEVQPGGKDNITIEVNDAKGEPVKDVNITAAAYNSQFNTEKLPNVPYLGNDKRKMPKDDIFSLVDKNIAYNYTLKEEDLTRLDLQGIYYYQMRFPNRARIEKYISLPDHQSQVSVFVQQNGKARKHFYVQTPYNLLQHNWSDINEGAYLLNPGYWPLEVRLSDRIITIDSVLIKNNHLTVVVINLDFYDNDIQQKKARKKLSKKEKNTIENNTLSIKNGNNWQYNWALVTANQLINIPQYYENSKIFNIGPIVPNTQLLLFDFNYGIKIPFEFKPAFAYSFNGPSLVATPHELFKKRKVKLNKFDVYNGNYFNVASELPKWNKYNLDDVYFSNNMPYLGECRIQFLAEKYFRLEKMIIEPLMTFPAWPYAGSYCPGLPEGNVKFYLIKDSNKYHQTEYLLARKGGTLYYNIPDENELPIVENNEKLMANFGKKNFPNYYQKNTKGTLLMRLLNKATDQPLSRIQILLKNTSTNTYYYPQSDAWGYIYLTLPPGTYDFSITAQGVYRATFTTIEVMTNICQFYEERCLVNPLQYPIYEFDNTIFRGFIDGNRMSNIGGRSDSWRFDEVVVSQSVGNISIMKSTNALFTRDKYKVKSPAFGRSREMEKSDEMRNSDEESDSFSAYAWSFGDSALPEPNNDIPTLRTNFKDNAYWVPTLYTNEKGKVSFGVTYPDDITTWKHYGAAMNAKKQTGIGFSRTKAYKKVAVELALPRFAIEGDEIIAIGKAMNYTGTNTPVSLTFSTNNYNFTKDTLLSTIITQKLPLTIPQWKKDQNNLLKPLFSLRLPNGYQDGEQRELPIYPAGTENTKGYFMVLENDTNFIVQPLIDGDITLHAENSSIDFLLQTLEDLKKYPYECNEQMASKLRAYLSQKTINTLLSIPFEHDKTIKAIIKNLEKAQNTDGSWGWWPKARTDYYMTAYILQSLYKAEQLGYKSDAIASAKTLIRNTVNYMPYNQALFALEVLSSMNEPFDYSTILKNIALKDTSFSDKMTIELIKARQNLGVNSKWIAAQRQSTYLGNAFYPGLENNAWHTSMINTLKVYEINQLTNNKADNKVLLRFFLEQKNGPYGWSNTIETAKIIETILPDFIQQKKEGRTAQLQVNIAGNNKQVGFPYTLTTEANKPIHVQYSGTEPVYFTAYQKQWIKPTESFTEHFVVSSTLVQDNKEVLELATGKNASLKVTVYAKKFGEYILLNVPIPAGCSYADKTLGYGNSEIHREYFKNEVAIFIENIGPGTYTYTVPLEVRYEGVQTLNPAKIELMYFPTFQGYYEMKKVEIKGN